MLFVFWSIFRMAESWARSLSLCLACKSFPGLCACTRTGRWCASVLAIRSLSLFTNRADRCSQINSLDSWCTTHVSKTLDVVHRYALLVSNSEVSKHGAYMAGVMWKCCRLSACSVYTIQPCTCLRRHFIRSHVCKVDVCLAVTCTVWQNDKDILHATGVTDTEVTVSAERWP